MSLDFDPVTKRLAELDMLIRQWPEAAPADPPAKRAVHMATGVALSAERDYLQEALRQLKRWPT